MNSIEEIREQWRKEKPELDTTGMELIGRLGRLARHLSLEMEKTFSLYDLNAATFDVLATLRRSGPPHTLSPGDLMERMMVSSGTVTNRIDQLEKAGLVRRTPNPEDKRGFLISLTEKGFSVIDSAVVDHTKTQLELIAPLSHKDRKELNRILAKYLAAFDE